MDQLTLYERMANSFVVVIVLLIIALVLQIVGFATPGWLILKVDSESVVELGLWVARRCVNGNCTTYDGSGYTYQMLEYQVETSLALGLLVTAILLYGSTRCRPSARHTKTIIFCTVIFALISGILALVAVCKFGTAVSLVFILGIGSFSYSLVLTGIGGVLASVTSLVIMCRVQPWKSDPVLPLSHEMQAQPNGVVNYTPVNHNLDSIIKNRHRIQTPSSPTTIINSDTQKYGLSAYV